MRKHLSSWPSPIACDGAGVCVVLFTSSKLYLKLYLTLSAFDMRPIKQARLGGETTDISKTTRCRETSKIFCLSSNSLLPYFFRMPHASSAVYCSTVKKKTVDLSGCVIFFLTRQCDFNITPALSIQNLREALIVPPSRPILLRFKLRLL